MDAITIRLFAGGVAASIIRTRAIRGLKGIISK